METFECVSCKKEKPVAEFVQDKNSKLGFRKRCKECQRPMWKAQKEQDKDGQNRRMRSFRSTVKGAIQTSRGASLQRAKKDKIPHNVSTKYLQDLYKKQEGLCALSGEKMEPKSGWLSPSLDKIIPEKGYVAGNVQWLTKRVNLIKSNFNNTELIELCSKIVKKGSETIETVSDLTERTE